MDYVIFFLIIAGLTGIIFITRRLDNNAKNKYRKAAYELLERPAPDRADIMKTLKGLHLYGGRFRKDKEFVQLIRRLSDKLAETAKKLTGGHFTGPLALFSASPD